MNLNYTFFLQILSFAILIGFTMKFIWPPLMNAIEERQKKIADGLAAADRSQRELAQAEDKIGELLKDARGKANEIIDSAADKAREALRQQVAALAVSGAEKLIRREIDAGAHKALLDDLAAQI